MRKYIKKIFYFIIGLIPKNSKKIVFESVPDLGDSTKVLYDYLKENRADYKFVWMVENPSKFKDNKQTKYVNVYQQKSLKYFWHVVTSKYIFFTHNSIRWVDLKKQCVVNLTHGLPCKKSKGKLPNDTTFNHLLSSSQVTAKYMADEHCTSEDLCFISSMPRNDLLYHEIESIKNKYINYDKLIVWLPTYRKHKFQSTGIHDTTKYDENLIPIMDDKQILTMNEKLKKYNFLLILKFHPAQDLTNFSKKELSNIQVISNQELVDENIHLYSLLATSKALLTDYSSVGLDYLLTDKPIGYVMEDYDEYKDNRGFVFGDDYQKYCAGVQIKNYEQLENFFDDLYNNIDNYKEKRKFVRDFYHDYQDGNSCEIITKKFNL